SRRRHTSFSRDWSSDVCSSDLEMHRVLRPGGRIAVLDFTTPRNPLFRAGYLAYFKGILPTVGNLVSNSGAYGYLSKSVLQWPDPDRKSVVEGGSAAREGPEARV